MRVDNFALTQHQVCPAKYDLRINRHIVPTERKGALVSGAAVHAGIAEWYRTHDLSAAKDAIAMAWVEPPSDDYRTLDMALRLMTKYTEEYPTENFKIVNALESPMIECTFTIETGMYLDCETCNSVIPSTTGTCLVCGSVLEPIEYGGIFDTLVEFSGRIYILEHKTTNGLTPWYFNQFKPNNQVTGYVWAATQLSGQKVGGAIINALGSPKTGPMKFARQITTRNDFEINEWLEGVREECNAIRRHERTGLWPLRTAACQLYGGCEYHPVHALNDPNDRERMLEQNYTQERWDYETREG